MDHETTNEDVAIPHDDGLQAPPSGRLSRHHDAGPRLAELPQVVTWRSVGIGCALIPIMTMWMIQAEFLWRTGYSTTISLFSHVTVVTLLIALVNLAVQKRSPRCGLASGEMLTIYVMLTIAGGLCSHDLIQVMIPMLTYFSLVASPDNRWDELILPHVPSWAIMTDENVLAQLEDGDAWLYQKAILQGWAKLLLIWSLFIFALLTALFCMNLFFRAAWTEKERLSFPVIQIPLMITMNLKTMLNSRLFWIGFGIAALINVLNGLHALYPAVPEIPRSGLFDFREYFVDRPWNSIAGTEINLYPFVIGLVFFIPAELAFSCWFFYLVYRVMFLLSAALGVRDLPGFPFIDQQAAGGYLAIGCLSVWLSRRHLVGVARTIMGRPGGLDQSQEPLSYRTTLLVFVGAVVVLIGFGRALGGSVGMISIFFFIFFLYSLAIARMRAELGPPAHDLHYTGPEVLLNNAVGTGNMGKGDLTTFSLFYWFNRAYRSHFSALSIEGLKIAQTSRGTARSMMMAMAVAVVVGLASAYWAVLHALHRHAFSGPNPYSFATEPWRRLEGWLTFPEGPNIAATFATGLGFVFTLFLGAMQTRFTWWLWHPIGYATASSWSMNRIWACMFVGWLVKSLIARYGGATALRTAMWFFVGLVLGEFVVGSFWNLYGVLIQRSVYHLW